MTDNLATEQAIASYDAAYIRLRREAQDADARRRPITATVIRNRARIVQRAALAERLDPMPVTR